MEEGPRTMPADLPETVYSPESGLRSPSAVVKGVLRGIFGRQSRSFAWRLFVRNISSMYRESMLGLFWVFFPPLLTAAVWIFLNQQEVIKVGKTGRPYLVFVLSGNLVWTSLVQLD